MKRILIIIGVMFYLLNITSIVAKDQNETQRIKKIENRLPKLNETKLKALMKRVGKPVPDKFFQCLCGPGMTGGGVSYKPGSPCRATGVLGGSWDQGFDSKAYKGCIKYAKYDDNTTIVDAILGAIENLPDERSPKVPEIGLQSLLKELFEKSCLPVPKNIDNLNPHEMNWFGDVLDKNHISSITQDMALSNIYDNIFKAENICEASIETKLSIDATQGKGILGTAGSLVWIVKGKDEFDIFKGYASITSGKVKDYKNLSKISKSATNLIKIFDYYNKYKSIAKTYNEHIDMSQKNADIKDALAVYKKSKSWNLEKINNSINNFNKSQTNIFNRIKRIDENREKDLKKQVLTEHENIICQEAKWDRVKRIKCNSIQKKYEKNIVDINWQADKEIKKWLITSNSNLIKSQILEQYRKPLIEKSCNEYIDDRLRNCPANIGRDKPLTHKDINKLWDATKNKITEWKEHLRHQDKINQEESKQAPLRRIQK